MTKEEIDKASAVLLATTPAARLADQVVMLSSLLDQTTEVVRKFCGEHTAGEIKRLHKLILDGPEK
jgi:hypothetical protein